MADSRSGGMFSVSLKKTQQVDLFAPFFKYASKHYAAADVRAAEADIRTLQGLRTGLGGQVEVSEAYKDHLVRYFQALSAAEPRFPISPAHCAVFFTWTDSFRPNKQPGYQANIHFEKAAVLFNLGAFLCQLGLAAYPSNVKVACQNFQAAAGAFGYLRDNVADKASVAHGKTTTTVDVSSEAAGMLERLMLAQAQECYYEKALMERKPADLCAKIAQHAAVLYEEAYTALLRPPLSGYMEQTWVTEVQGKALYYGVEAMLRFAVHLESQELYGAEIARLRRAAAAIGEGRKSLRWASGAGSVKDRLAGLEKSVASMLDKADRQNEMIYWQKVPDLATLADIEAVALARPLTPSELHLDGPAVAKGAVGEHAMFSTLSQARRAASAFDLGHLLETVLCLPCTVLRQFGVRV